MALTVEQLIPKSQTPETLKTATKEMPIQEALKQMIEYDFSQLPVIDEHFKIKGLVTSDSILRAVSNFKATLDKLKVSHATFNAKTCRLDDDISDLLNKLRDVSAIPIIDNTEKLIAIITNYDTAEYFRQRAEDLMLAEDIETSLRDYIEYAFKNPNGDINIDALNQRIVEIMPSGNELRKKFKKALCHYIKEAGIGSHTLDNSIIEIVFRKHLDQPIEVKKFEDLTLFEYIQLFKILWENYKEGFYNLEWNEINNLLDDIRQTRNAIAHFREVTPTQRQQMKFCADLLDHHSPMIENSVSQIVEAPSSTGVAIIGASGTVHGIGTHQPVTVVLQDLQPTEEEVSPSEGRYAPLAIYLQNQVDPDIHEIQLTFNQVEEVIQNNLPPSARNHRNWWANDAVSHTQSQQWLDVGWRVSNVNMSNEKVTFSRTDERRKSYINFFNGLTQKLQEIQHISFESATNPQGRQWLVVKVTSNNVPEPIWLAFSFARRSRFRVELYIETGNQNKNKQIFDQLVNQKTKIEEEFGKTLNWERLDNKRASRIAAYRENSSIAATPEELETLQEWAVLTMERFYRALAPYYHQALSSAQVIAENLD